MKERIDKLGKDLYPKINSNGSIDLNVKFKTIAIKLLKDNIGGNLDDLITVFICNTKENL